jgi:ABC-2 type transport system ATP-binding protein
MPAIDIRNLTKTYQRSGTVRALDDATLSINRGEIFGFLGPNGAGKTTLVKILLSIVLPSSGEASLLDVRLPDVRVREKIGYLPENHRFPSFLTGEAVLSYFGSLTGMSSAAIRSRSTDLLKLVGMEQWRGMKVKRYSKGMLQRIGLANALLHDPELVFLDEPTDGVDPVGRAEIREVLRGLRSQGKTVFLNSHLLSEVELVCDRVAIIDRGKILKVGTISDLTSRGNRFIIGTESPLPETIFTEARAMAMPFVQVNGGYAFNANTNQDLNRIIDLLRRDSVIITAVAPDRTSLEDSFLALLKKEVAQ